MSAVKTCGGQTMSGRLERVLVCAPEDAGWSEARGWERLGYLHEPRAEVATRQHRALLEHLSAAGAEVLTLGEAEGLSLDAVYAHDASFPTDHGMLLMHMGKASRRAEADAHQALFEANGIPVLGRVEPPGISEGGDMVWLDASTLLIGEGYRTNAAGIEQIRALLGPHGVDVIGSPLPYGPGPDACLHLMSLMSVLDERVLLVDLEWLAVPTVTLLESKGFDLVPIVPEERDRLACNVLALGERRLLAIEENEATNRRLEAEGFGVNTFPGEEICRNGSGGPTCLTRPLLRS